MSDVLPVDTRLLDYLFLHLLRIDKVFQQVAARLRPSHLYQPHEATYRAILAAALEHYERLACLPTLTTIVNESLRILQYDETVGPQQLVEVENSLRQWYNTDIHPQEVLEPRWALECLQQVLLERTVGAAAQQLATDMRLNGQADYTGFAEEIARHIQQLGHIQHKELQLTAPEIWAGADAGTVTTGVPFIDSMVPMAEIGDVNTLIGPSGVAKTTLAIQMMCGRAKRAYEKEQSTGEKTGLSVYISYEDNMRSLQIRAVSCACQIHKDRLAAIHSPDELSTLANLQDYERKLVVGNNPSCEQERYTENMVWLNSHSVLVDFSNHPDSMGGMHGISEIRSMLGAIQDEKQREIDDVYCDYAGLCAERALMQKDGHSDRLIKELGTFVDRFRSEITVPFNAVGWVLQQVNGKAQQASPVAKLSHTNAEWCKAFANNAFLALVLGTKDVNTWACMLAATKTRRGMTPKPIVCRINGALCCLVDASKTLRVDGGRIESVALLNRMHSVQAGGQQLQEGPQVTDRLDQLETQYVQ